jgi:hypothetical protein
LHDATVDLPADLLNDNIMARPGRQQFNSFITVKMRMILISWCSLVVTTKGAAMQQSTFMTSVITHQNVLPESLVLQGFPARLL